MTRLNPDSSLRRRRKADVIDQLSEEASTRPAK
jgi:hypothetical protein